MFKNKVILLALLLFGFVLLLSRQETMARWVVTSNGILVYEDNGSVLGKKETPPGFSQRETRSPQLILEREGGKIRLRVENKEGQEQELPEGSESGELVIEEPEDNNNTTIKSTGNAYMVIRNKIAAQTHFPLMVNLETNELIVTTPAGQKVVTVLPDAAVAHMLAANVLDQLGGKGGLRWLATQPTATPSATPTATPSGEITPTPGEGTPTPSPELTATPTITPMEGITLTITKEGTLAYEIPGLKFKKLLGVWKVTLQRVAVVSAETGELLDIQESPFTRILDLLSV